MAVTNNNGIPYGQPAANAAEHTTGAGWPGWPTWVTQVQQTLRHQQEQIAFLQKRIDMLMAQLKAAEAKPTYHIDKIEYQFDQLKIEKLDGTLNIGIQPSGDGSESDIDQFIVQQAKKGAGGPHGSAAGAVGNGNGAGNGDNGPGSLNSKPNVFPSAGPASMQMPPPFGTVQTRVNEYLDSRAQMALVNFEQQMNVPLDPYHRRIIIEDIRRQAPTRIQFYMQQAAQSADIADANSTSLEDQVTAKTIRDVDMAMRQYLNKLSSGDESAGGVITV